jgi:hypothetical protein
MWCRIQLLKIAGSVDDREFLLKGFTSESTDENLDEIFSSFQDYVFMKAKVCYFFIVSLARSILTLNYLSRFSRLHRITDARVPGARTSWSLTEITSAIVHTVLHDRLSEPQSGAICSQVPVG